jgi:hypothetical protein
VCRYFARNYKVLPEILIQIKVNTPVVHIIKQWNKISMDGKGRAQHFIERLWRTVKYENVYLQAYTGISLQRT